MMPADPTVYRNTGQVVIELEPHPLRPAHHIEPDHLQLRAATELVAALLVLGATRMEVDAAMIGYAPEG